MGRFKKSFYGLEKSWKFVSEKGDEPCKVNVVSKHIYEENFTLWLHH